MQDKEKFEYSYSAPTEEERREINSIRMQYRAQEKKESKIDKIRALDRKVKRPAEISGISSGIAGALLLGTGMCLTMEVIGSGKFFVLGIVVGITGIALCASAYFIYKAVLNSRKKKYGDKILKLSDEFLSDGQE